MKKSLTALALLSALLPGAAWAATDQSGQSSFNYSGLYGGVGLGFSSVTDETSFAQTKIDQGTTGFSYGAFAGYGMVIQNPWYLGGEIGIGNTTGSADLSGASVYVKESQDYAFNADLRAGRTIGQSSLGYVKLGWAHTEFNQRVTGPGVGTSTDTSFDGLRIGAGAETALAGNLTGRLEAIYTDYGSQTINNVKYSPDDVGVRLGVSYYFY